MSDAAPLLSARNASKQYAMGTVLVSALGGVDFSVARGEFVAIMGPSGSGKSTLLHLLGGLDQPSGGAITLDGQVISELDDRAVTLARRRRIGFIFQFFNLLPTLSAEENIGLPLLIDGKRLEAHRAQIERLLDLVGLRDRRNHKPDQLSGGQQQRVAIARAFVTNPAIVLADEPTGNLDSRSGGEILQLLRRSCDELGQTIVMVTHDAGAASYADRIVFLKDGRVAATLQLDQRRDPAPILEKLRELET